MKPVQTADSPLFKPTLGLRQADLQSILASLRLRRWLLRRGGSVVEAVAKPVNLYCTDATLQAHVSLQKDQPVTENSHDTSKGLVILIHGWEGSHESVYLLSLAATLYAQGYDVCRLNLRDHGATHHLNTELFHACRLDEVYEAVAQLLEQYAKADVKSTTALVGFSLGGNFALRVGLQASHDAVGLGLDKIYAISPVLNPKLASQRISAAKGYHRYFMRKWRRSLQAKQASFPQEYDFGAAVKLNTMQALTDYFIDAKLLPYPDSDTYFSGYQIKPEQLAEMAIDSQIIMAADDPVIPVDDFFSIEEHEKLKLQLFAHGGHCGFIENWRLQPFTNRLITADLAGSI